MDNTSTTHEKDKSTSTFDTLSENDVILTLNRYSLNRNETTYEVCV